MFGYRLEENFDLAKEERRSRLMWVLGAGICLLIAVYFIHPFSMSIFQAYFLTSLFYGDSFYVQRRDKLTEAWLWKAFFTSVPLHVLILIGILGLDRAFPSIFTKIVVFIPLLTLVFGIEAILFDEIASRFNRSEVPATG
jgi:hypothetical protein